MSQVETTVVWRRISGREPGRPTPYQRRLHALAQAGRPGENGWMYDWVISRDVPAAIKARFAAFLYRKLTGAKSRWPSVLDRRARTPRVAGDGLRTAARPAAPRAPSAPSRSTSRGRTLAA